MKIFFFGLMMIICAISHAQEKSYYKSSGIYNSSGQTVGRTTERSSIGGTVTEYSMKGGNKYSTRTPATGSLTERLTGKPAGKSNSFSGSTGLSRPTNSSARTSSGRK
jgi:hypothetical protein